MHTVPRRILRYVDIIVNGENRRNVPVFRAIFGGRRTVFEPGRDEEQGGQQESSADRHNQDPQPGIATIELHTAREEAQRQKDARPEKRKRNRSKIAESGFVASAKGQAEQDVDGPQQGPVRVRQAPPQATRLIGSVEVGPDLEPVKRLQNQAQPSEDEQPPPAEAEVAMGVVSGGHSL